MQTNNNIKCKQIQAVRHNADKHSCFYFRSQIRGQLKRKAYEEAGNTYLDLTSETIHFLPCTETLITGDNHFIPLQFIGVSPPSEDKSKKATAVSGTAVAASIVQKVDTAPSASEGEPSPKKAKPAGSLLKILLDEV